ncbi:MAG: MotA/TolQ/ExbB proton channel family protein [bacterium]|nr:MotA/TolQ/ExbB proton channel family protein [bacterium]
MKRIFDYLRIDWNNRKHARLAVMMVMVLAAYAGLFIEQSHAQAPAQAQEAPAATEEASAEGEEAAGEAEESEAPASDGESISFVKLFNAGGWSMWPLLIASIVGLMVIMERLYYYQVTKVTTKTFQQDLVDATITDGLNGAEEVLEANKDQAIASILKEGLAVSGKDPDLFSRGVEREAGGLMVASERGLAVLAAVSTIAPLIGFLGTVSGMIGAFDAIATADSVNAKVVAGGIKEALITTATGLIVGIPAMAFFQYFSSRVNGWATDVEQAANSIYKELLRRQSKSTTPPAPGQAA